MHRAALDAAARAHLAASRAWTATASSQPGEPSPAATLRERDAAAHRQRAQSYAELLEERDESASRNGAWLSTSGIAEISVPTPPERAFLESPVRAVKEALESAAALPLRNQGSRGHDCHSASD